MRRTLMFLLGTAIAISTTLFAVQPTAAQNSDEGQRIYVCNQGEATLSVIDVSSNEIIDNIDLQELGFSANAKPHHTIAEADGSHWYVTLIGANRVLKFNRQNELVGQAEMEVPGLSEPASHQRLAARRPVYECR
ncbi:MAG: hypothetical protein U5J63_02920 [Fodinibius sp.]|nr:hypothetical protein [Fodinibius sp.]